MSITGVRRSGEGLSVSPYRGGPPRVDDEPPPDFKASSSTASDEAFHLILMGAVLSSATFVTLPLVSAATFACGVIGGGIAYATHERRRKKRG
jgi:hypothetical protein